MAGRDTPPITDSPSMLLVASGGLVRQLVDRRLAERRITLRHVGVLGHLGNRPDLSYSDLARRSGVTSQSMRAIVHHLEQLRAVRPRAAGQGRRAEIAVTPEGRRLLAWARDVIHELDRELWAGPRRDPGALVPVLAEVARRSKQALDAEP